MSLDNLRIFVLGDSRTGTTSLHQWFLSANLRSIHYYIKEAGLIEPLHKHRKRNWEELKKYIDTASYDAFSDYPTRIFFRELMEYYPVGRFILTTRRDNSTWLRSMRAYFSHRELDFSLLEAYYICLNEEIRSYASYFQVPFLDLCIDDGSEHNSKRLGEFLEILDPPALGWYNKSC